MIHWDQTHVLSLLIKVTFDIHTTQNREFSCLLIIEMYAHFAAEISVIIVDNDSKCNQLLDRAPKCLKKLIAIRDIRSPTILRAKNRGVEVLSFRNVEQHGASRPQPMKVNRNGREHSSS